jgi:hypothetical protein
MLTLLCIAVADSAVDTEDSEVVVVVATAAAAAAVVTEWATSVLVCKDKNGVRLSMVFSPIFDFFPPCFLHNISLTWSYQIFPLFPSSKRTSTRRLLMSPLATLPKSRRSVANIR